MNIFEINKMLRLVMDDMVDPETGDIDEDAIEVLRALDIARDEKIEGMALVFKEVAHEVDAYAHEIKVLTDRKRSAEKKAERLKSLIAYATKGEKFKTARVSISFCRQMGSNIIDESKIPEAFYVPQPAKLSKTLINEALKAGKEVPGVEWVQKESVIIQGTKKKERAEDE